MRYCIDHEETNCFERNGFVLLKELLSPKKIQKLLSSFHNIFQEQKDSIESQKREAREGIDTSFYGRDVAIQSPEVRKILFSKEIGQIACHLSLKKKLRYGGDWLWQGNHMPWIMGAEDSTLSSSFCINPIVLACLIALTDLNQGESHVEGKESPNESLYLPEKAGDALYFSSNLNFPWLSLQKKETNQKFLLFVYAEEGVAYMLNPLDPHTHYLKRLGYVFGDRLKETTHPHIVR